MKQFIEQLKNHESYKEAMGHNGYQYAQIHFDWEQNYRKLKELVS